MWKTAHSKEAHQPLSCPPKMGAGRALWVVALLVSTMRPASFMSEGRDSPGKKEICFWVCLLELVWGLVSPIEQSLRIEWL